MPKQFAVRRRIAYIARNFHSIRHSSRLFRESARGTPVHLSHGRPQQGLWHQEGAREYPPLLLPGRQDRHPRAERRRQVDHPQDHGRHRQGVERRGVAGRRRHRRLPGAGAGARCEQDRVRERHGRRRRQDRDHRTLQRIDDELFRRDGRRVGQAPGRDGPAQPVGSRTAGRDGDGSAGLPAQGSRRHQAVGRRAPPRGTVPAAAAPARPPAARRADQPSRRRDDGVAGKASARLSRRGDDHHPRSLLPRQCHRLDPRARPRPRHSL